MATKTQNAPRSRKAVAPPTVPEDVTETREDKFKRLGQARVTRALNAVRLVGNLGSPNYHASDEYKARIIAALRGAVDSVEQKFTRPKGKQSLSFAWEDEKEGVH